MMRGIITILFGLILRAQCGSLLWVFQQYTTATYQCLRSSGYHRVGVILGFTETGVDEASAQNLANALTAGLEVEAIIGADPSLNADLLIDFMRRSIRLDLIEKYWVLPEGWQKYDPSKNCQYLQEFLSDLRDLNLEAGVITNRNLWSSAFQDQYGCPEAADSLLWWIPEGAEADNQPNFNSYKQIGGWTTPYMKLFNIVNVCGTNFYENYYK